MKIVNLTYDAATLILKDADKGHDGYPIGTTSDNNETKLVFTISNYPTGYDGRVDFDVWVKSETGVVYKPYLPLTSEGGDVYSVTIPNYIMSNVKRQALTFSIGFDKAGETGGTSYEFHSINVLSYKIRNGIGAVQSMNSAVPDIMYAYIKMEYDEDTKILTFTRLNGEVTTVSLENLKGDSFGYEWDGTTLEVYIKDWEGNEIPDTRVGVNLLGDSFRYRWDGTTLYVKTVDNAGNDVQPEVGVNLKGDSLRYRWDDTTLYVKAVNVDNETTEAETGVDLKGDKGDQGIQGPVGPRGEGFSISGTYATIAAMNADVNNPKYKIGDFVLISSNEEDPDNSKLYVLAENNSTREWNFLTDMSGAQGIQGEQGYSISAMFSGDQLVVSSTDPNTPSVTSPHLTGPRGYGLSAEFNGDQLVVSSNDPSAQPVTSPHLTGPQGYSISAEFEGEVLTVSSTDPSAQPVSKNLKGDSLEATFTGTTLTVDQIDVDDPEHPVATTVSNLKGDSLEATFNETVLTINQVDVSGNIVATTSQDLKGTGVPNGGEAGQVLSKRTSLDYDFEWMTLPEDSVTSVNGETGTVVLDAADVGAVDTTDVVTSTDGWSTPTSDTKVPSEKLTKESLDGKVDKVTHQSGLYAYVNSSTQGQLLVTREYANDGIPRYENGRLKADDPATNGDVANKSYVDGISYITAGTGLVKSGSTINHSVSISQDTTSTASPALGGTFTAIDSVTRDGTGHVTTLNTKTVTLPTYSATDGVKIDTGVIKHTNTVTAGNKGTASKVPQIYYDAQGHITSSTTETDIQIAESQVTNLTTDLSNKVDKTTTASQIYGTSESIGGVVSQVTYNVSTGSNNSDIVQRQSNGQITVPSTPVADTDAASKAFVNSSIGTSTANFLGTYSALQYRRYPKSLTFTSVDDYVDYYVYYNSQYTLVTSANKSSLGIVPGTTMAYTAPTDNLGFTQAQVDEMSDPLSTASGAIATALSTAISGASNNDYCYVEMDFTDPASSPDEYRRYKYNGTSWDYEYTLNNSSFTQVQWDAINSGITSTKVAQYDAYASNKLDANTTFATVNGTSVKSNTTFTLATKDLTNVDVGTANSGKFAKVKSDGSLEYVTVDLDSKMNKLSTSPTGGKVVLTVAGDVDDLSEATSTLGSATKPIYLSSGTLTEGTQIGDAGYLGKTVQGSDSGSKFSSSSTDNNVPTDKAVYTALGTKMDANVAFATVNGTSVKGNNTIVVADTGLTNVSISTGNEGKYLRVSPTGAITYDDPAGGVTSVNSKTGAVTLTASDVGALPDNTTFATINSTSVKSSTAFTLALQNLTNVNAGVANAGKYLRIDTDGSAMYDTAAEYSLVTTTLPASGWSSNAQTISVTGVTTTNVVMVASAVSNQNTYSSCGVKATAQGSGTVTFGCTVTPNSDLDIIVMVMEDPEINVPTALDMTIAATIDITETG